MKKIGKINVGGDPRITAISNSRELNNLARRAIANDEPVPIPTESGANSGIVLVARGNGIYIRYPNGTEGLLTQYIGRYIPGIEMYPGQMTKVEDTLSICVNTTYDSPEIYPTGVTGFAAGLGGNPTPNWVIDSTVFSVKYRGIQANVPDGEDYLVSRIAYWVPTTATDQQYALYIQEKTATGEWFTREILSQFAQTTVGWHYYSYGDLWRSGRSYRAVLAHISVSGETNFTGTWEQINANRTPSNGQAVWYNNNSRARFDYQDSLGVNRETQLRAVPVGATIEAGGFSWNITGTNFRLTDADFNIDGPNRLDEGTWIYRFSYGAPTSIENVRIAGYFSGTTVLRGVASNDGAPITESDNAFGVDVEITGVAVSEDHHILSLT